MQKSVFLQRDNTSENVKHFGYTLSSRCKIKASIAEVLFSSRIRCKIKASIAEVLFSSRIHA